MTLKEFVIVAIERAEQAAEKSESDEAILLLELAREEIAKLIGKLRS